MIFFSALENFIIASIIARASALHNSSSDYIFDAVSKTYAVEFWSSDEAVQFDFKSNLRSYVTLYFVVPRHCLSSYGRRSFAVVSPTAWNSRSDDLRDVSLRTDSFRRLLKTRLFSEY